VVGWASTPAPGCVRGQGSTRAAGGWASMYGGGCGLALGSGRCTYEGGGELELEGM
jgi:hypothetical protein